MRNQKQNNKIKRKTKFLYGLAFIAVLLGILYVQFSFIFQDSNEQSNLNQAYKKNYQEDTQSREKESYVKIQDTKQQSSIEDVSSESEETEDIDQFCFELFQKKIDINLQKLLMNVKKDIDHKLKDSEIKKQEIIRQYELLSKQNLDFEQVKLKFQNMESIYKNQEGISSNSNEEGQQKEENEASQKLKDKKLNEKNTSFQKLPYTIQLQLLCFVQYYDENQDVLSYDVLKQSEFIENEYYLLQWENKNSFYDLLIHLHNFILLQQQINWQNTNQEMMEINSTLIYFAKVTLNNLFNFYQISPQLFQYIDPQENELNDIKNSLPMNQVIKNIVDQWEGNWSQLDLPYSSHLQIKREEKRQEQFEQLMQNTTFENDRLKQNASKGNQRQIKPNYNPDSTKNQKLTKDQLGIISDQSEIVKSEQKQGETDQRNEEQFQFAKQENQELERNESAQLNQEQGKNENQQNVSLEQEIGNLFEELSQQNNILDSIIDFEKQEINQSSTNSRRADIKKIIELYSEEDSDEITTLEETIKSLWKSRDWNKQFSNLSYNNYFLAKKKSTPTKK